MAHYKWQQSKKTPFLSSCLTILKFEEVIQTTAQAYWLCHSDQKGIFEALYLAQLLLYAFVFVSFTSNMLQCQWKNSLQHIMHDVWGQRLHLKITSRNK